MAKKNAGKVMILPRGDWNASVAYTMLDLVHVPNSGTYLAIKDVPAGTAVTNTTYWQEICNNTGIHGGIVNTYSASAIYDVGDYVMHDGILYTCNTAITSGEAWNSTHWTKAVLADDLRALKSKIGIRYDKKIVEPTNEFDYTTVTPVLYFNQGATIYSENSCNSVLIPVDYTKGTKVTIHKGILSLFSCLGLPFDDPSKLKNGDVYSDYPWKSNSKGNTITLDIDSRIKSIFVWYYYGTGSDAGKNPTEILKSISMYYGEPATNPVYTETKYSYIPVPFNDVSSKDFNSDEYFLGNCNVLLESTSDELRNTPVGDNVSGTWSLRNELVKDTESLIISNQTAIDHENMNVYKRQRYYDVVNKSFDVLKDVWTLITNDGNLSGSHIDAAFLWNEFTSGNADEGCYMCKYIFEPGKIETVKTKINSENDENGYIVFVNSVDGSIIKRLDFTGHGEVEIAVNETISVPFYLGISCNLAAFVSGTWKEDGTGFPYKFKNLLYDAGTNERDIIDISKFAPTSDGGASFCIAHSVKYAPMTSLIFDNAQTVSHNNFMAIGDSITAGYNSFKKGGRWWEIVARHYHYDVFTANFTGAGMSYYNGTNACKMVTETDLSKIDLLVVAFGVNDYYNNQPIGNIDDEYTYSLDSSQSFYAATKYVIEKTKEKNKGCVIVFSLPLNLLRGSRSTKWALGQPNDIGKTLNDYIEAIINVCNLYCVPYIDHRCGAFDVYSLEKYTFDGLHLTPDGYKILGMEMIAKLGCIIQPYPEYEGEE